MIYRSRNPLAAAAAVLLAMLMLAGCSETKLAMHMAKRAISDSDGPGNPGQATRNYQPTAKPVKVGKPYQIRGVWYYPKAVREYDETGLASWYGSKFHGRRTANGDVYDMYALTAAHKTLPMPSRVQVTNLENGRQLTVYVNDRGPFVHGRIIDLSYRAAQLLGFDKKGVTKVRVTLLGPDGLPAPQPNDTRIAATDDPTGESVRAIPQAGVASEQLTPLPGTRLAAANSNSSRPSAGTRVASGQPRVRIAVPAAQSVKPAEVKLIDVPDTDIYVQAGAFMVFENAHKLRSQLSSYGSSKVHRAKIGGRDFFRVRIGPLASVDDADRLLLALIENGHSHASIVVD